MGKYIAQEIVKTGKHQLIALTRQGSQTVLPEGIKSVIVDYDNEESLIGALKGQQFLIITLSVLTPPDTQAKLVKAAAAAGVLYVMPNFFGCDIADEALMTESPMSAIVLPQLAEIEKVKGDVSSIPLVCNLWYPYSLVMGPMWVGFDFSHRKITFYDDGNTKINMTSWEQIGRTVAGLVSLKELPDAENDKNDTSPTISSFRDKPLYISSFLISQKDMFESWKRVTGETDSQWTFEHENSKERYAKGMAMMQNPDPENPMSARMGAGLASFVRIYFPGGGGDYESTRGLHNDALGLPKEDLDELTRAGKKLLDDGYPEKQMRRIRGES